MLLSAHLVFLFIPLSRLNLRKMLPPMPNRLINNTRRTCRSAIGRTLPMCSAFISPLLDQGILKTASEKPFYRAEDYKFDINAPAPCSIPALISKPSLASIPSIWIICLKTPVNRSTLFRAYACRFLTADVLMPTWQAPGPPAIY